MCSDGDTWGDVTDAALMAEFRRRAATTTLYLDADLPADVDRARWQALCAWEQEMHQAGNPIYPCVLRAKLHEIAGSRVEVMPVFAVNTTRYERPLDEVTPA